MTTGLRRKAFLLAGCMICVACSKPAPPAAGRALRTGRAPMPAAATNAVAGTQEGVVNTGDLVGALVADAEGFAQRLREGGAHQGSAVIAGFLSSNVCVFDDLASALRNDVEWRETDAALSGLAARVRAGTARVEFRAPEDLRTLVPADVAAYLTASIAALNADARSAAAKVEILRAQNALRNGDGATAVAVLTGALGDDAVNADTRADLYQTLAIAFNYQEQYRNEAEAQGQTFNIMYARRHELPRFVVTQACRPYLAALLNARSFDAARQLIQQLEREGYNREELVDEAMYDDILHRRSTPTRRWY